MTVGLAMLVKDAEETLPATLASALPAIDAWTVIVDEDSTDMSMSVAKDALRGLPGEAFLEPFKGFGPARTELLELAAKQKTDYTLMLDSDHTLHVHGDKPDLSADSYLVKVNGPLEWRLPLLTRTEHQFEYRGAAHAYLASDEPTRTETTDWLSIVGGPGATREKLERDRGLLEADWLEHPADPRTTFYLARTYDDLNMPTEAIRFYLLRADMGGFEEERWYARYKAGFLLGEHVSGLRGVEELVKAWRERPGRAEALRALARLADSVADKMEKPDDLLFVTPSAYGNAA